MLQAKEEGIMSRYLVVYATVKKYNGYDEWREWGGEVISQITSFDFIRKVADGPRSVASWSVTAGTALGCHSLVRLADN